MPRGNGTGPMGMGSMTGRAAGFCAGSAMPGYANQGQGRGVGGGRRGQRNRFYATGVPGRMWSGWNVAPYQGPGQETEKDNLKNKADALQAELNQLKTRLDEIEP
jgi:hypothetical protein